MNNLLIRVVFFYSLLLSYTLMATNVVHAEQRAFRIMSYNVRNGLGMDMYTDLDRLAKAIIREVPDFVALQEIDSATARNQGMDIIREIGSRTQMDYRFAPAIDFDGGKYGVGILCRQQPVTTHIIPLPGREEERVLLISEFDEFILACTHLSLTPEDRIASLEIIRQEAAGAGKPFILAGDFNARPGTPFLTEIQQDFTILSDTTLFTFPADTPRVCIDYITAYNRNYMPFTVTAVTVCDEPVASDHRPVMVDILITQPDPILK